MLTALRLFATATGYIVWAMWTLGSFGLADFVLHFTVPAK